MPSSMPVQDWAGLLCIFEQNISVFKRRLKHILHVSCSVDDLVDDLVDDTVARSADQFIMTQPLALCTTKWLSLPTCVSPLRVQGAR